MDIAKKLTILADAAKYDASCASSGGKRAATKGGIGSVNGMGICHSYAPDGRCISLLKILLSNVCIFDCSYCINRVSSDVQRAKFSVEEVVRLTLDFYRRNYIEGLFLSSGVFVNADRTMEEMCEVARQLRLVHGFGGYIHLKAVAGASTDLVERAGLHADRVSANIELPTQQDLNSLAPAKTHAETEGAMRRLRDTIVASAPTGKSRFSPKAFAPAGQSTQMIVGATPTPDSQIIATANHLYSAYKLRRVYYSSFSPIAHGDPKLPAHSPPLVREHRLYQADWLVRFYGFAGTELTTAAQPNLDLALDPKLGWALRNRHLFPVDVNRAARETLLRVPGLGVQNVERILRTRRHSALRLADLAKMRVPLRRTRYFVVTADFNPALQQLDSRRLYQFVADRPQQLELFATARASEPAGA
jgi:putative DNA modification/repair radical SAM protein